MAGGDQPLRVFWSYSHKDEGLRDELHEHLAGLRRARLIADWHDRKIGAGKVWKEEIDRHLGDADLVLLLVSASFLASDYCWGDEMAKALSRHVKGEARVIPVILRPCDWQDTPIAELQAVPKDARPITQWGDRDLAYLDVTSAIRRAVEELTAAREQPKPAAPSPGAFAPPSPASGRGFEDAAAAAPLSPWERAGVRAPATPKLKQKNGVYIGADPRDLPDLAVFKDDDLPWLPEMVVIPAGTFLMGSPPGEAEREEREGPQHRVTISRRFAIGRYAVTFDEYDHFCEVTKREKPEDKGWGRGRRPLIKVSWEDAQAYLAWLSGEVGHPYRLPSEAEWEYACRAGTMTAFSFGATITPEQVNYDGNRPYGSAKKGLYRRQTVPVGSLPANDWGLYEMHGNVWEWCHDGPRTYGGEPVTDPLGPIEDGAHRAVRGGSWYFDAWWVRSASRNAFLPGFDGNLLGFRLSLRSSE
jgi:Uncharacterized conserved protein